MDHYYVNWCATILIRLWFTPASQNADNMPMSKNSHQVGFLVVYFTKATKASLMMDMKKIIIISLLVTSISWWLDADSASRDYNQFDKYKKAIQGILEREVLETDPNERYSLGNLYYEGGSGLYRRNYKTAAKYYTQAAEQRHAKAQIKLSALYSSGEGVVQSDVKAHMWANIAQYNGYGGAKIIMGTLVSRMTWEQISKAQDLAQECVAKDYKSC